MDMDTDRDTWTLTRADHVAEVLPTNNGGHMDMDMGRFLQLNICGFIIYIVSNSFFKK
jgi:hypothetical protein